MAFLWEQGVCAPKSTEEELRSWLIQESAQSSSASEVSAFTPLSSPVPESNHHPPTVPRDKTEPAGRRKPLIFPCLAEEGELRVHSAAQRTTSKPCSSWSIQGVYTFSFRCVSHSSHLRVDQQR
ncbi:uncharacterized protein J5F26_003233 [Ciconia maguari]